MVKLIAWDWRVELLTPERRKKVLRVYNKPDPWRLCAKCRFMSGCLVCDAFKCLRYHLAKVGYVGPAVWGELSTRTLPDID